MSNKGQIQILKAAILAIKHEADKNGWSFDFELLKAIESGAEDYGESVSKEGIEAVLFSILNIPSHEQ